MATTARTAPAASRGASDPTRKTALVAGILYLITFATSIPAALLLDRAVTDPTYVTGAGADGLVRFAALLDLANALACIGTAVALYSVLKRQHEGLALGFVTSRTFEARILVIAVLSISSLVTLRESGASAADASSLVTAGQALVAVRDWSFGIGTGMAALNALLLGTLMYRSRLVPRVLPVIGLVGGVLFSSFVIGYILGVTEHGTAWHSITVAPIFVWELALGLWMTFKGFRAPAVAALGFKPADADGAGTAITAPAAIATKAGAA